MAPRDIERAAWAARLRQWREAIGETPAQRLRWLLAFAYDQDVSSLSDQDRAKLRFALLLVVQDATAGVWTILGQPVGTSRSPEADVSELRAAQREIRAIAEGLIGWHVPTLKIQATLYARIGPREIPAPPTPREQHVLVRSFLAPLPQAVALATVELIGQVGHGSVRRCPFDSDPPARRRWHSDLPVGACGRVFVARRRQKSCEPHRQTARQAAAARAMERFRKKQRRAKRRKKGGAQ